MSISASSVISSANSTYKERKGSSFLAVGVPIIIGGLLNSIIPPLFGGGVVSFLVSTFITASITYMAYKMILNVIRGEDTGFESSLTPFSNLIKFIGVLAVFTIFAQLLNELMFIIFDTEAVISQAIGISADGLAVTVDWDLLLSTLLPMFAISIVIMFFVQIRFYLTQYLVIDNEEFVDAFKTSWLKTKGNVWTIIKVHLYIIAVTLIFAVATAVLVYVLGSSGMLLFILIIALIVFLLGYFIPYLYLVQAMLFENINDAVHIQTKEVYTSDNEF